MLCARKKAKDIKLEEKWDFIVSCLFSIAVMCPC